MTKFDKWFKSYYGSLPINGDKLGSLMEEKIRTERVLRSLEIEVESARMLARIYEAAKRGWEAGTGRKNCKNL